MSEEYASGAPETPLQLGELGIGADAAGHHRHADALGLVGCDQGGDVELVVDHQEVRALPGAQRLGGPLAGLHVGHLGACGHGHLHRLGDEAGEASDDEKPHVYSPLAGRRQTPPSPSLMISVMVTPRRSSTTTTSPRATRRLLT